MSKSSRIILGLVIGVTGTMILMYKESRGFFNGDVFVVGLIVGVLFAILGALLDGSEKKS